MKKLLIISSVWVEPNSSAAGSRVLQLIQLFKSVNWAITYVSTSAKSEFAFDLSKLDIPTRIVKLNDDSFNEFLIELQPDIVLFDRFIVEEQFGWRVSEILPNALRILDTEDLHCLRKTREIAVKSKLVFKETDLLKQDVSKREIASVLRCDLSIIISTYEMQLLKNTFGINGKLLIYIPFLLDKINTSFKEISLFEERSHFYFIGNFLHEPNFDGVLFLKTKIWPKLSKKLPKANLHIYGAYPSHKVNQLHNKKERFLICGRTENIKATIQKYKVCLAPLRFGAGLKGKFIEAMQNGTPSITTSIGAEAMHENTEWNGFIANEASEIIEKAVLLYTHKKTWQQAQKNGIKIINTFYDKKKYGTLLIEKIDTIQLNLEAHRNTNFMGALLQHHSLKSNKYLSKWIMLKNKKNK